MLLNYFKIALRSLWKNRTYSFVNIIGLAVGIATSILILLFVSHEYSFDRFHKNSALIYQVIGKINYGGMQINTTAMSQQFGPKLKEVSEEVDDFVRTRMPAKVVIESDANHRFFEQQFLFADPSLFNVFSFEILRGNPASLSKPNVVMITEAIAKKYFGEAEPIGKVLTYDNKYLFEVVGIIKKAPSNSSIQFDFITPLTSLLSIPSEKHVYDESDGPGTGAYLTYVQIKSKQSIPNIERVISKITKQVKEETYLLSPFTKTHEANVGTQNVNIFLSIAVLILVLALINYINLTTARGLLRAKEVGIRKTIGAKRSTLTIQFYLESALTTLIAFVLAIVLIELFISVFLNTIQQDIDQNFLISPVFITLITSLLIICILLSGRYPALVLSQFKPVEVLKGKLNSSGHNHTWLKKGFIVFQFAASMALIICSLVIQNQLEFMRSTNVGLDKDQILVITIAGDLKHNYTPLKEDLRELAGVRSVAASSLSLYHDGGIDAFFTKTSTQEELFINMLSVDNQFFSTLNIEFIKREKDSISTGDVIVNEAALTMLKMTANDLGKGIVLWTNETAPIEAIVKDFNYTTLKQGVGGLVMTVKHDTASNLVSDGGALYVKLDKKTSASQSIAAIKKLYERYESGSPFHYYFLDDAFDKLYRGEERLLTIFQAFTLIAIVIACLGLFGLITFSSERRAKEIGIRKILGASIQSILTLLSLEFVVLIAISLAIAAPLAWWAMHTWLQGFSYRIEIPMFFTVVAGVASLAIALGTISFQALKAALANPVDSLRNE